MSEEQIRRAAKLFLESSNTVALTGAGVSTKSGIPDFRGPSGLWTRIDPEKFASINAFLSDPKGWWETALNLAPTLLKAKPNPAHKMLAKLEHMGLLHWLVTQNIDGLHQKAGSRNVIEIHGSLWSASCIICHHRVGRPHLERFIKKHQLPPICPSCGGILKLDVVLFGEALPPQAASQAFQAAKDCQLMVVVGSSLLVYPAASLPAIAANNGAHLVIINQEPTPLDSKAELVFHAEAGDTLARIVKAVERERQR